MRSTDELTAMLMEHLSYLGASFLAFDNNEFSEAKRIANSIYTIVFDKGRSVSILTQLGVKERMGFVASGEKYAPPEKPASFRYQSPPLLNLTTNADGFTFAPKLGSVPRSQRQLSFEEWWNEDPIFWYQENKEGPQPEQLISRNQLISSLTDQDGGRHLDPKLSNPVYRKMKRDSDFIDGLTRKPLEGQFELKTARQIGWELVESIKKFGLVEKPEDFLNIDRTATIFNSKLHCCKHVREKIMRNWDTSSVKAGLTWSFQIKVDSITTGFIQLASASKTSEPITSTGLHSMQLPLGEETSTGFILHHTDATIDRMSIKKVQLRPS